MQQREQRRRPLQKGGQQGFGRILAKWKKKTTQLAERSHHNNKCRILSDAAAAAMEITILHPEIRTPKPQQILTATLRASSPVFAASASGVEDP